MSSPRYEKYKDSGVEWLGEVPEHWHVSPLKRLAKLVTGLTPPTDNTNNYAEDEGYPWVRPEDLVESGRPTKATRFLSAAGWTLARKIRPRATLICCIGTIGKVGYVVDEVTTNQQITSAQFAFSDRFFYFALCAAKPELEISSTGNVLRILNTERLGNILLACPAKAESEIIGDFLDRETAKIDALVEEQRRLIELLKEQRQAVISHAVTKGLNLDAPMKDSGVEWFGEVPRHWKVGKCGFYIALRSGFAFPSAGFSEDENDIKLLRGINVGVSQLKWDETVYWRRAPDDGLDPYELQAGDLVMGMDRPVISEGMRVARVKQNDLPCLLLQRVALLKVGHMVDADYLFGLLSSEMFVAHFSPETTGVSVPHISPEQIYNFLIPLPPIEEQRAIASFVATEASKFDELASAASRAMQLLQERRSALISAAVTGKIDVRGLVKEEAA